MGVKRRSHLQGGAETRFGGQGAGGSRHYNLYLDLAPGRASLGDERSTGNSLFSLTKTCVFQGPGSSPEVPEGRAWRRLERSVARPGGRRTPLGALGVLGRASGVLWGGVREVPGVHFEAPGQIFGARRVDFWGPGAEIATEPRQKEEFKAS